MERVQLVCATCKRIHEYTTEHMLCTAQQVPGDDSVGGIINSDNGDEDVPSVVRAGVTPNTADPDDVGFGV